MTTSKLQQRSEDPSADADSLTHVRRSIDESIRVKRAVAEDLSEVIVAAARSITDCFRNDGKVLLFGNGGSASDAQHIAAEWTGRYQFDRPALPAIALSANSSESTAIGNDYGFEHTFGRLIEAHGRRGDVALALSTSGNSANVLYAVKVARERGLTVIGLLGKGGGKLAGQVDIEITVPSDDTPRIQESHITIGHILCELIEVELFPQNGPS